MLILVRHGESEANAEGRVAGVSDVALTDRGRAQAAALAGSLAGAVRLAASPLSRAVETARLAVPHLAVELDAAFLEQDFGVHEMARVAEVPEAEWRAARADHGVALGGGESPAEVDARVHARLDELLAEVPGLFEDPQRHLVVVSHVSPIKSAVAWALGVSGQVHWRLRLDNASLTVVAARGGRPLLVTYNDVSARGG